MADIKQAVQWMKEGKKVKHSDWSDGSFVCYLLMSSSFKNSSGRDFEFSLRDFERTDWIIHEEKNSTECCKGGLWFTTMRRIVLDDHNCETFAEPHDKKLMTKEELTKGISIKEFNDRLDDALVSEVKQ